MTRDTQDPWSLRPRALGALARRLTELEPKVALEFGSGWSTVVMRRHCGHLVSLEHMPTFYSKTKAMLDENSAGELRLARIVYRSTPAGELPVYETRMPENVEFVLIDGPPASIGRTGTLFQVWDSLAPNAVVWLDDYRRKAEQRALRQWRKHYEFEEVEAHENLLELRPKK